MFSLSRTILRSTLLGIGAVATVSGFTLASSSSPAATAPTAPADSQADLQATVIRLSDRDPSVRDQARQKLMGLAPTDLPVLRASIAELHPLSPGVAGMLHDIVTHVYLAGQNADGDTDHGFMGVLMNPRHAVEADDDSDSLQPLGVVVEMRLPGFDAYRVLRDGDVILGLATDQSPLQRVHVSEDIMSTVAKVAAGQHLRLQIIRNGRRMEATVTLAARPSDLSIASPPLTFDEFRNAQEAKAEAFWAARFAPLVDAAIS